jgi:hypothetical protein
MGPACDGRRQDDPGAELEKTKDPVAYGELTWSSLGSSPPQSLFPRKRHSFFSESRKGNTKQE